eukprot:Nitzschia sp. Nitz4//scaffold41_size133979//37367//38326//NITZ4_003335-RA/size133979-processed-gene-0.70-mRNA-1//-1//CDS//3329551434//7472//frame0
MPLHWLCLYRAPKDLIELVIEANPGAMYVPDAEGWTPLHLVILYGGSNATVMLLIERGGTLAVSLHSPSGGTPLHLACRHGSSPDILQALVAANQTLASTPSDNGTKPAEVLCQQFSKRHKHAFRPLPEQHGEVSRQKGKLDDPEVRAFSERIQVLLRAVKERSGTPLQRQFLIHELLQHLSSLGDTTEFLDVAVHLYPEQLTMPDLEGNLPLHLAATTCGELRKDALAILVSACPAAARLWNRNGELPLHVALKGGQRVWGNSLQKLLEAHYAALEERDKPTGLYPYQLAGAISHGKHRYSLGTIFELMTACPHVVSV